MLLLLPGWEHTCYSLVHLHSYIFCNCRFATWTWRANLSTQRRTNLCARNTLTPSTCRPDHWSVLSRGPNTRPYVLQMCVKALYENYTWRCLRGFLSINLNSAWFCFRTRTYAITKSCFLSHYSVVYVQQLFFCCVDVTAELFTSHSLYGVWTVPSLIRIK